MQEAGKEIRDRALKRRRRHKSKSPTKSSTSESDVKTQGIVAHVLAKKECEEILMKLDERHFALEEIKEEREAGFRRKIQDVEAWRVKVDEKGV